MAPHTDLKKVCGETHWNIEVAPMTHNTQKKKLTALSSADNTRCPMSTSMLLRRITAGKQSYYSSARLLFSGAEQLRLVFSKLNTTKSSGRLILKTSSPAHATSAPAPRTSVRCQNTKYAMEWQDLLTQSADRLLYFDNDPTKNKYATHVDSSKPVTWCSCSG